MTSTPQEDRAVEDHQLSHDQVTETIGRVASELCTHHGCDFFLITRKHVRTESDGTPAFQVNYESNMHPEDALFMALSLVRNLMGQKGE